MVETGRPQRHTAAGSRSADGCDVDIAYEPPAVDIVEGCLVVVYACGLVRGQNHFSERFLSMAQGDCIDARGLLSNCSPDDVMRIAFLLPAAHRKALLRSAAAALEHLTALTLSTGGACRPGTHTITHILDTPAQSYRPDRRLESSQVIAHHCERFFRWTPELPPTGRYCLCRQRFGWHDPSVRTAEPASHTSRSLSPCPFNGRTTPRRGVGQSALSPTKALLSIPKRREGEPYRYSKISSAV